MVRRNELRLRVRLLEHKPILLPMYPRLWRRNQHAKDFQHRKAYDSDHDNGVHNHSEAHHLNLF